MDAEARARWSRGPLRVEIRCTLEFSSPLHVGTGERLSIESDAPVLRDAQGRPWLPGSSIRGVLRDWCEREAPLLGVGDEEVARMFGAAAADAKRLNVHERQGRLRVYDLELSGDAAAQVRDRVRVDARSGAAAERGKYDHEVAGVQSGVLSMVYEGWHGDHELVLLQSAVQALRQGLLSFGAKGSGGLGFCEATAAEWTAEDRTSSVDLSKYLRSRITGLAGHQMSAVPEPQYVITRDPAPRAWSWMRIDFDIQFEGPMLVAALHSGKSDDTRAARVDATYQIGLSGRPLLAGSSLRGAMRSQARRIGHLTGDRGWESFRTLFGPEPDESEEVNDDDEPASKFRGLLSVKEGTLEGTAHTVLLNHVAIDRLTGFAADRKLFSSLALASPTFRCGLLLRWCAGDPTHRRAVRLLMFTLRDLANGTISIGSRSTRGYGAVRSLKRVDVSGSLVQHGAGLKDGPASRSAPFAFEAAGLGDLDADFVAQLMEVP